MDFSPKLRDKIRNEEPGIFLQSCETKSGTKSLGSRLAGEASAEPDLLVPEDKPGTGIAFLVYSSLQVLLYEI